MLILGNLGLTVSSDATVYESVVKAWRAALLFMENAVLGVPQTVQSASVLLALSSWHLYPDLTVLGDTTKDVKLGDPLVTPGGIITIGLQGPNTKNEHGISWSLPLSHLRYYGEPVQETSHLGNTTSRVSMQDFLLVVFGCVTRTWTEKENDNLLCARFFIALDKALKQDFDGIEWLRLLAGVARDYQTRTGEEKATADKLIGLGRRRCQTFLDSSRIPLPLAFNMRQPEVFHKLLNGTERRIRWLRAMAADITKSDPILAQHLRGAIIKYFPSELDYEPSLPLAIFDGDEHHEHPVGPDCTIKEYPLGPLTSRPEWASLFPVFPNDVGQMSHRRWIQVLEATPWVVPPAYSGDENAVSTTFQIPTCVAERSFSLEDHTSEPCTIMDIQSVMVTAKNSPFGKIDTVSRLGTSFSETIPHVRPTQGAFLDAIRQNHYWASLSQLVIETPGSIRTVPTTRSILHNTPRKTPQSKKTDPPKQWRRWLPFSASSHGSQQDQLATEVRRFETITRIEVETNNQQLRHSLPECEIVIGINTTSEAKGHKGQNWDCGQEALHCIRRWYLKSNCINHHVVPNIEAFGGQKWLPIYLGTQRKRFSPGQRPMIQEQLPANDYKLPDLTLEYLIDALESNWLNEAAIIRYLGSLGGEFWSPEYKHHQKSMQALMVADGIYSDLAGARVSLGVLDRSLHDYAWADDVSPHLAHARTFSCISTFDSGCLDIVPSSLNRVIGLSSGNSLFISRLLWSDPHGKPRQSDIRRSIGNVGKPGMSFLISPQNVKMRSPTYNDWTAVAHHEFDGQYESNFGNTSMHLAFTGYEQALDLGQHGLLDSQALFLESVVQVYDRGNWIADLDILNALTGDAATQYIRQLPTRGSCSHDKEAAQDYSSVCCSIISVDSWAELLDPPKSMCIVRAGRNWLARLAAVAVAAQKSWLVFVAADSVCWACVGDLADAEIGQAMIVC